MSTIFAVSSGAGRAGVAVIRVSGPEAGAALIALTRRSLPEPRRAVLRRLLDAQGQPLDTALVLWFPGPASFTGEDCVEFHCHGGRAVVRAVLGALADLPGCRQAEAGEFTRRAFAHGRLDLTEVEGLADLIAADTESQRRAALRGASGAVRAAVEGVRGQLIQAMALIAAMIDFADEEDAPDDARAPAEAAARRARAMLARWLEGDGRSERRRDGVRVVLAGPPNAGKSSLLNALAARDVAIVSEEAGTTRDALEVHLDLGGVAVTVIDTAGLRATDSLVEQEGIRRTRRAMAEADLVLALSSPLSWTGTVPEIASDSKRSVWVVWTMVDRMPPPAEVMPRHAVSNRDGAGIIDLLSDLTRFVTEIDRIDSEAPYIGRERQRAALSAAAARLDGALCIWWTAPVEILADELRLAAEDLGRVTGVIGVEDLLDVVFREFCIGK